MTPVENPDHETLSHHLKYRSLRRYGAPKWQKDTLLTSCTSMMKAFPKTRDLPLQVPVEFISLYGCLPIEY
ncbi:hypothetical protein CDAR_21581 [Caerostris darwini]|uniref:Uncharacterized protein n=1 Tax=Caerostris darwini TaxID=1538125 RepID=A0AAV4VYP4_9ARAC|nr:hypothetical protein CDAR_21581 [Caerostris darwini]